MSAIADDTLEATSRVTSKGQFTLPAPIRQFLGIGQGTELAIKVRGTEIVVTKADEAHTDPAIEGFLGLLSKDIAAGNVTTMPAGMEKVMRALADHDIDVDELIEGDVGL